MKLIVRSARFLRRALLALSVLMALPLSAQTPPAWQPPLGIPYPTFGINESHWMYADAAHTWDYGAGPVAYRANEFGPYTHYIDNTHPAATDTNNPFGTPEKPRRTWLYPLPAGSCVQIHGGPYSYVNAPGSKLAAGGTGTVTKPIFFYGTTADKDAMPKISSSEFYFFGDWTVVEKLCFVNSCKGSTRPLLKGAPVISMCIRDCYFKGSGVAGNPTCITTGGSTGNSAECFTRDLLIWRNEMHAYGDWQYASENDACGIIASQNATNIWVLDNEVYNMGGDSIRIGADQGDTASGGFYYVGRNHFHDNRENAIDVKQARDSVISENILHGFAESSSSSGTAVAIHYNPRNVWIINNRISNTLRGIASTGVDGNIYIIGNTVYNCTEYGMYLTRGGGIFHVVNNTIASCANGLTTSGTVNSLHYSNNIVANITSSSGYHLQISDSSIAADSTAQNFLFYQQGGNPRIYWAGETYTSVAEWIADSNKGAGSVLADPKFVTVANVPFKIGSGSPAIDAGVSMSQLDATFRASFNVSLLRDADGNSRPSGPAWDIGADEFPGATVIPRAPTNLRVLPN